MSKYNIHIVCVTTTSGTFQSEHAVVDGDCFPVWRAVGGDLSGGGVVVRWREVVSSQHWQGGLWRPPVRLEDRVSLMTR